MDPATSHKTLLSEGNRKVTWADDSHHPGSSSRPVQVLCEQGLRGRCYWEVKVSGPLAVGVSYRGADTKHSDGSWSLVCSSEGYCVQHDDDKMYVSSLGWRSSWVGVYLDWSAGTLSFYRVSADSLVHLHTFRTAFTEPLYPAVELQPQSSAVFCSLL